MSQWKTSDAASNTSLEWAAGFKKKANTANRSNLYQNTTANAFVRNAKVGVFGVSATELNKQSYVKVASVSVGSNAGANYANGNTIRLSTGTAAINAVFTVTTGASNTSVVSLAITNSGAFSVAPDLTSATTANGSANGLIVNITLSKAYEGSKVPHTGWNTRIEGTGNRAGRVQYETLVAGGIISDNTGDDALLG